MTSQSEEHGRKTQLVLDWSRCEGHGVCSAALRELIDLDRWGFPGALPARGAEIPRSLTRAAALAAATCPATALRLERS